MRSVVLVSRASLDEIARPAWAGQAKGQTGQGRGPWGRHSSGGAERCRLLEVCQFGVCTKWARGKYQ